MDKKLNTIINDIDNGVMIKVLREGEFIATLNMTIGTDYVGDLTTAHIDFAEYVYVNGKHWMEAAVRDVMDQKEIDRLNKIISRMHNALIESNNETEESIKQYYK
ncbi:MAG TPA: hypothetical protein VN922_01425 [Bacteroidia bacterium]|nr:hypothetical protein [Bacteroidia bacterium]